MKSEPFEYIKNTYHVEPKIGQRVRVDGKEGTIKEDRGIILALNLMGKI